MAASPPQERDDHARIAACAYQIWLREGCPEGRAEEHWAIAEYMIHWGEADEAASHRRAWSSSRDVLATVGGARGAGRSRPRLRFAGV